MSAASDISSERMDWFLAPIAAQCFYSRARASAVVINQWNRWLITLINGFNAFNPNYCAHMWESGTEGIATKQLPQGHSGNPSREIIHTPQCSHPPTSILLLSFPLTVIFWVPFVNSFWDLKIRICISNFSWKACLPNITCHFSPDEWQKTLLLADNRAILQVESLTGK